jgi:hypothetical protein
MMAREVKFVTDSPLEGAGFEPSVPRRHVEDAPWNFDVVHRGWHTRYKSINSSRGAPLSGGDPAKYFE